MIIHLLIVACALPAAPAAPAALDAAAVLNAARRATAWRAGPFMTDGTETWQVTEDGTPTFRVRRDFTNVSDGNRWRIDTRFRTTLKQGRRLDGPDAETGRSVSHGDGSRHLLYDVGSHVQVADDAESFDRWRDLAGTAVDYGGYLEGALYTPARGHTHILDVLADAPTADVTPHAPHAPHAPHIIVAVRFPDGERARATFDPGRGMAPVAWEHAVPAGDGEGRGRRRMTAVVGAWSDTDPSVATRGRLTVDHGDGTSDTHTIRRHAVALGPAAFADDALRPPEIPNGTPATLEPTSGLGHVWADGAVVGTGAADVPAGPGPGRAAWLIPAATGVAVGLFLWVRRRRRVAA